MKVYSNFEYINWKEGSWDQINKEVNNTNSLFITLIKRP